MPARKNQPRRPAVNAEPRLHVNTGAHCNNNCLFCAEGDREARAEMVLGQSPEDLLDVLERFPSREHVCFTTGEPTLNPLLPWLIRSAADEGYREVALITNGRRLSDEAYLDRLLGAGLDLLTVSIHGHQAADHDRLTRAPGSFAQTLRGLRNASGRVARLHTSTVVSRMSLGGLRQLLALLGRLGVDQAVLNVVKPRGRADRAARALLPSHGEVVEAVASAMGSLGRAAPPLFVEDVPPCATVHLPAAARGVLEHNVRYDREVVDGRQSYEEYDRRRTEGAWRVKRPECRQCRYDDSCPGPWARYVDVHGWDGLDPVT